ncbi:unnamed protein product [Darwinula stevensoni]|uniref:Uncharacterized protein n=1 Tax=Darwinula stevensoni TaxID=69355 RepID=A0A7R9A7V8_9CRUS|nr:unnamed protein product [Darwinula stevensoni]CAG0893697.1 unnamed protein product [Darwinula stevensoni]
MRTTILPQPEKLKDMLKKIQDFHFMFLERYKGLYDPDADEKGSPPFTKGFKELCKKYKQVLKKCEAFCHMLDFHWETNWNAGKEQAALLMKMKEVVVAAAAVAEGWMGHCRAFPGLGDPASPDLDTPVETQHGTAAAAAGDSPGAEDSPDSTIQAAVDRVAGTEGEAAVPVDLGRGKAAAAGASTLLGNLHLEYHIPGVDAPASYLQLFHAYLWQFWLHLQPSNPQLQDYTPQFIFKVGIIKDFQLKQQVAADMLYPSGRLNPDPDLGLDLDPVPGPGFAPHPAPAAAVLAVPHQAVLGHSFLPFFYLLSFARNEKYYCDCLRLGTWCMVRDWTCFLRTCIRAVVTTDRTSGTITSEKISLMRRWFRMYRAFARCFTENPSSWSASTNKCILRLKLSQILL